MHDGDEVDPCHIGKASSRQSADDSIGRPVGGVPRRIIIDMGVDRGEPEIGMPQYRPNR